MRLLEHFRWGDRTFVMGVLNVTPDSFSGDGLLSDVETVKRATEQASQFLSAGADILDVGGESTRPGSRTVSVDEEIARVIPVVMAVAALPGAIVSIDSYKAEVAEAALAAGAQIINDVWGLRADPEMAGTAVARGAPVILMHNRSRPNDVELDARLGGSYLGAVYDDLMVDICREIMELVDTARAASIPDDQIIVDPGIGFGKTVQQNLAIINQLNLVKALGFPVLLGASRKSFIGHVLDVSVEQRLEGSAAAGAIGISRGADIIRVHDVDEMTRTVRMTDAILRAPTDGASKAD
jgi:dihydropteroate synthase